MPRGDRTGPLGQGSMTGRQMGCCAGSDSPGFAKGPGRGLGLGFFGRGRGNRFFWRQNPPAAETPQETTQRSDEMTSLKEAVNELKKSLSAISERINRITQEKK